MNSQSEPQSQFDICIFCALAEEARAVIEIFERIGRAEFQSGRSRHNREYRHTTVRSLEGEPLTVHLSWPPDMGPQEASLHITRILDEFRPSCAIMTGICAGDRRKVVLGDLIVADRAFTYDAGKFVTDDDGTEVHQHDTDTKRTGRRQSSRCLR